MKFKNYIETESGIKDTSTSPGAAGQVLSSTVSGTSWIDQSTLVSGSAERVSILVKNGEGTALVKGDPVYIIGSVGASARLEVGLCDASDPSKMPCVGLLEQDLLNNGEGTAVTAGKLRNLITTPIDGQPTTENDTIYVKAGGSSGLALTTTKPTGSTNLIQNVGQVGRVSASSDGNFVVSAIMRTNDVPNLPTGKIWVGDGNTTVSTIVHLDETNGRMGVGTASPGATFHVSGGAIRIDDAQQLQFGNGNVNIRNDASGRMYLRAPLAYFFEGNGGYKMVLDGNSGNLGIGTTSPSQKLEVVGTISSGAGAGASNLGMDFGGLLTPSAMPSQVRGVIGALNSGTGVAAGSIGYQPRTGVSAAHIFFTEQSERMRITSSGNLGIGTTSPAQKLHVDGSIRVEDANDIVYANKFFTVSNGNLNIGANDGYDTVFFNGPADERMRIKSNGNVGIGTTSPVNKLNVNGDIGYIGVIGQGSIYGNTGNSSYANMQLYNPSTGYSTFNNQSFGYYFQTAGSTKVTILNNGNVGIGTTSPSYKLDVAGDLRVDNGNVGSTSGDEVEHVKVQGGRHFLKFKEVRTADDSEWKNTTFKLQAGVDSTNHQSIDFVADGSYNEHIDIRTGNQVFNTRFTYDGNVGIGTTSPAQKLHVIGNSEITGDIYLGRYIFHDNDTNTWLGFPTSDTITFRTAGSDRVRITSIGNVGVGTSTPLYLLDAAGTIRCTSLIQTSQSDKKENISSIDKSKPRAIPFKEYRYKSDIDSTGRKRYGVLAEDIEDDYPELVYVDSNGDKAVNYIDLLVKRVAELEKELEDISLTPGPKGDKGDAGSQGSAGANGTNGKNGVNGNDHLKNVKSITFNEKSGQLEITIEGYKELFRFNLAK